MSDGKLHAVMSSIERRGAWLVPRELTVRVKLGNAELDLRDALLEPGLTTIHLEVKLGNVEIIVPPGLPVEMSVSSWAGNASHDHDDVPPSPDAVSRVRITGARRVGDHRRQLAAGGKPEETDALRIDVPLARAAAHQPDRALHIRKFVAFDRVRGSGLIREAVFEHECRHAVIFEPLPDAVAFMVHPEFAMPARRE